MSTTQPLPVYSSFGFGTDPDMLELVQEFVGALPDRVEAIEIAVRSQDLETLRRLAHQLKGAGGGYGFNGIGQAAAALEASARASSSVNELNDEVQGLISLCRRAKACPESSS